MFNAHNAVALLLWLVWIVLIIYLVFISRWKIWLRAVLVTAILSVIIFLIIMPMRKAKAEAEAKIAEKIAVRKVFGEKAFAHFRKQCESAGFFVYKEVPKQDSVLIMNPRLKKPTSEERDDQYWMGDPYALSSLNHGSYSASFDTYTFPRHECKYDVIKNKEGKKILDDRGFPSWENIKAITHLPYFKFIEIPSQDNPQQMMRYFAIPVERTLSYRAPCEEQHPEYKFQGEPIDHIQSEYGYKTEDISTKQDRDLWIAGGRLQIIHLKTGEVVAERIGYIFDNSFGGNQHLPAWDDARQYCPGGNDNFFIIHVLSEKLERVERKFNIINKLGEGHE